MKSKRQFKSFIALVVLLSLVLVNTLVFATPTPGIAGYSASKTPLAGRMAQDSFSLTFDEFAFTDIPGEPLPASGFTATLDEYLDFAHVYSVALTAGQRFIVTMTGDEGTDFDLALYAPDAVSIFEDWPVAYSYGFTSDEHINYYVPVSGTYYLVVEAYEGSGQYSIEYEITEPVDLSRIFGASRYETAVEVSKEGWTSSEIVFLTRGDDYADALAAVPLAYAFDAPILLTRPNSLPDATRQELERLDPFIVFIIGGEAAVSTKVETALENMGHFVYRYSGKDRFETAALLAEDLVLLTEADTAVVAYSHNFPDALAAASYAAREGLPILLTRGDRIPRATQNALDDLEINETIVVGGAGVINDSVLEQLPNAYRVGGRDRYATSVALAQFFGVPSNHLFVATGRNFADAITSAVLAAKQNTALLLVGKDLPFDVAEYIIDTEVERLVLIGGTGAISLDVEADLAALIQ